MDEELERRLKAVELDIELIKVALLKQNSLQELETVTTTRAPELKAHKPITVNKNWSNLVQQCREAEKRGKVDEVAYDAIHGSSPSRV
jgi:hypothetical protein